MTDFISSDSPSYNKWILIFTLTVSSKERPESFGGGKQWAADIIVSWSIKVPQQKSVSIVLANCKE